MNRFVVLEHDHPTLHWDLMLEGENALETWRLSSLPQIGATCQAEKLPDHRMAYLEYEGPVSKNRGNVTRWDEGRYFQIEDQPRRIGVRLVGKKFIGLLLLKEHRPESWEASFIQG
jgi:hypothetical protein